MMGGKMRSQQGSGVSSALRYVEWMTGGTYTWDVPPELRQGGVLWVDAAAAGGGGGGGFSLGGGGGGGAGGEWCEWVPVFIPPGATQLTIVVGAGGLPGLGGAAPTDGQDGGYTTIRYGATPLLHLGAGKGGLKGAATLPGRGGDAVGSIIGGAGTATANANGADPPLTGMYNANFSNGRWNRGQIYQGMPGGCGTYATSGSYRSSRLLNLMANQWAPDFIPATLPHTATDTGLGGAAGCGYVPRNVASNNSSVPGFLGPPWQITFTPYVARDARIRGFGGRGGRAAGSVGYDGEVGADGFVRIVY